MNALCRKRGGFIRLEVLLALASVALVFQIWPSLNRSLLWAVDVRNWNSTTWFVMNLVVISMLVAIRFAPDLYADWQARRRQSHEARVKADKVKQAREHREMLEGIRAGRRRRIL